MKTLHLAAASKSWSQIILLLQFLVVVFHVHKNVQKASRESSCDGLGIKTESGSASCVRRWVDGWIMEEESNRVQTA